MGNAVSIAFLTVLVLLTLIAVRTWYQRRGAAVDAAQERVFRRFVLGLLVFWMVAVAGFLWGLGWPREAAKVIGLMSDERLKLAMVRSESAAHCASTTSVIKDDSSNGTCSPPVDLITSTRTRFITPPISRPGVIMCLSRAVVNGLLRPSPSSAT